MCIEYLSVLLKNGTKMSGSIQYISLGLIKNRTASTQHFNKNTSYNTSTTTQGMHMSNQSWFGKNRREKKNKNKKATSTSSCTSANQNRNLEEISAKINNLWRKDNLRISFFFYFFSFKGPGKIKFHEK